MKNNPILKQLAQALKLTPAEVVRLRWEDVEITPGAVRVKRKPKSKRRTARA